MPYRLSRVAYDVANHNQRESGLEAARETDRLRQVQGSSERGFTVGDHNPAYAFQPGPDSHSTLLNSNRDPVRDNTRDSYNMSHGRDPFATPTPSRHSNPFDDAGIPTNPSPGRLTPQGYPSSTSIPITDHPYSNSYGNERSYSDNPYGHHSSVWDPRVSRADIDPNEIDDDGDDMLAPAPPKRRSVLGFNTGSSSSLPRGAAAAATGGAAAGGAFGAFAGMTGRDGAHAGSARDASGQYGPVGGQTMPSEVAAEKSAWLNQETSGRKRMRWIVGIIIVLLLLGAIAGGIYGGVKRAQSDKSSGGGSGKTAAEDDASGDLDKNSAEIQKLMNNPGLHKVLPGVDYTPFNAQYPDCLSNPPSQNNVTRDVAVLSQLTNTLRLYGNDCNQTEMIIHAIDRLGLSGFKFWLGVWLDNNSTTVDRQVSAMRDILDKHGKDPFVGVVVGNEVLFRKDMTETELGTILDDTKKYLNDKKIDLPIATSDLGDAWTANLASKVDVVMANVHPFFAGVTVDLAAGWTYDFWTGHNVPLTQGTQKKNVVSEVGWPSAGGTHCGQDQTTCTTGSTAGIDEMNQFMDTYICQSLANGTDFFW